MPIVEWKTAPDLKELASPIIEAHHPHLVHAPLRFVWRSEAKRIGIFTTGEPRYALGTAQVISSRNAYLIMSEEEKEQAWQFGLQDIAMFMIEIAENYWMALSEAERMALLDHELCHCVIGESKNGPKLEMASHDIEEFENIVRRHGIYRDDLGVFAAALLGMEQ